MQFRNASLILVSVSVLGLLPGSATQAATPKIKDDAGFFSAIAIKQANDELRELQDRYDLAVVIETYSSNSPPVFRTLLDKFKKPEDRARFWDDRAKDYAKKGGARGVAILILKEPAPGRVLVEISPSNTALPPDVGNYLQSVLSTAIAAKENDKGLMQVVQFLGNSVQKNLGPGKAIPPPTPWGEIFGTIFALVGLWLALEVLRQIALKRTAGAQAPSPGGTFGGGSPTTGLFASLAGKEFRSIWAGLIEEVFRKKETHPAATANVPVSEERQAGPIVGDDPSLHRDYHSEESKGFLHDRS